MMGTLRLWVFPVFGAVQHSEGAILTILRREIGVLDEHLSVRTMVEVPAFDRGIPSSSVPQSGSLWPLIGLAVVCWVLLALAVQSIF